jgi:long-chain acyl-CoA synthetase
VQVLVHGANRAYNTALLVPNWEKLTAWAVKHAEGIKPTATPVRLRAGDTTDTTGALTDCAPWCVVQEEVAASPKVAAYIQAEVVGACKDKLKKFEIPEKFLLIKHPFTIENDMLTQKLSIKRHIVFKHYSSAIDAVYSDKSGKLVHVA